MQSWEDASVGNIARIFAHHNSIAACHTRIDASRTLLRQHLISLLVCHWVQILRHHRSGPSTLPIGDRSGARAHVRTSIRPLPRVFFVAAGRLHRENLSARRQPLRSCSCFVVLCSRSPPSRFRWRRGGSRWRARSTSEFDHGSVCAAAHVAKRTLLGSIADGSCHEAIRNEPSTDGSTWNVNFRPEVKLSERRERRGERRGENKRGLSVGFRERWGRLTWRDLQGTGSVKGEVNRDIEGSLREASKLRAE